MHKKIDSRQVNTIWNYIYIWHHALSPPLWPISYKQHAQQGLPLVFVESIEKIPNSAQKCFRCSSKLDLTQLSHSVASYLFFHSFPLIIHAVSCSSHLDPLEGLTVFLSVHASYMLGYQSIMHAWRLYSFFSFAIDILNKQTWELYHPIPDTCWVVSVIFAQLFL